MSKMRKILTIRTPFIIRNSSLFYFAVRIIADEANEQFIFEPDQEIPLNFEFYSGDMSFKILVDDEIKRFSTKNFEEDPHFSSYHSI